MAAIRLTQRRVDTLRPRKAVRNVRDAELKGYGVRVMPSGAKRYFVHSQHRGHRVWKIVGDAAVMTEAEARGRARSMLAALRDGRDIEAEASGDVLFETVAEEVFSRYGRRWKPRTLAVNRGLSPQPDPALLRGPACRRDRPGGGAALVPLAPCDAGGGEPFGAGPVGHHAAGRSLGVSSRWRQPLQGHPALPAEAVGAFPVAGGIPPPRHRAGPA